MWRGDNTRNRTSKRAHNHIRHFLNVFVFYPMSQSKWKWGIGIKVERISQAEDLNHAKVQQTDIT